MVNIAIYFLVLGSILGWVLEIVFKTVVVRESNAQAGMSNGPFCLLYGIGTFYLAQYISKYTDNILYIFIFSLITLTALEYVTGVFLNKVFNIGLWDYSKLRFGINKHISVEFMLMWGVLGVIFVLYVLPVLNTIYFTCYCPLFLFIIYAIFVLMIYDYLYTSIWLLKQKFKESK